LLKSMTTARIYGPAKNAMRSIAQTKSCVLDFEQASPKAIEPLMGWTSSADVRQQVRCAFTPRQKPSPIASTTASHIACSSPLLALSTAGDAPRPRWRTCLTKGPLKVRAFRQGDGKARWPEPVSPQIGRCTSYGAVLTAVSGGTKSNRRQLFSASSSGAPATQ
jgi:hypothetical protein